MSSGDVAALFKADVKTVIRWAEKGLIPSFRTPGGSRRYHRADIAPMLRSRPILLRLTDEQLQAAGDMLAHVISKDFRGPLTDEQALPLFNLLCALTGGAR